MSAPPEPRWAAWLTRRWYAPAPDPVLLPLAWLFGLVTTLRRGLFRLGLLRSERVPVPVVVVGNLVVGGAGKTPVVIALVKALRAAGWNPGVVSRGYGGGAKGALRVNPAGSADVCGDEPLLIARETGAAVAVARRRVDAARLLLAADPRIDCLLSDDGLQHYALHRDVELLVFDAARGLGNGALLPAGPLREPRSRLARVSAILSHGSPPGAAPSRWPVGVPRWHLAPEMQAPVPLTGGAPQPWAAWQGRAVHAVAGIGHPERFFAGLRAHGLAVQPHPYPDHHRYAAGELSFAGDDPVLLTAKDAVKCAGIASTRYWVVPLETRLPADFLSWLIDLLETARGRENP